MGLLAIAIMALALLGTPTADAQGISITRSGEQPSRTGPAENFTGAVQVDPLFAANDSTQASGAYVSFERSARTAWHTHPRGQVLIVTSGVGRVQAWGHPIEEIRTGDVVRIPPNTKHWHGASFNAAMRHLAIQEHLNGAVVEWMEHVTDAQYGAAPTATEPSTAQRRIGEIAPKTQVELIEAITHLASYAGWPSAMTAISVAQEVLQKK